MTRYSPPDQVTIVIMCIYICFQLPLVGQLFRGNIVPEFTLSEVAKHHDFTSCWIVVSDKVYDVTEFLNEVCMALLLMQFHENNLLNILNDTVPV